ncbi:MAG: tripartite tricarboxylate transporter substrate binding protein [Betaproteobacteria bacterium]|nr:tripartite tricarboxylate transporter substrate binding protein [Betaproteobacteria bacterium]
MRLARVRSLLFLLGALYMAQFAYGADKRAGAAYPTKPIRLIVPFSPGGTNDIVGRMVAQRLSQTLGETMIVDNRLGAEGIIGTNLAANAAPDGYTLVVISSAYTMNPVVRKLPYDTLTALEFVAKIGASFSVLSVGPLLPVNSVKDLLATAERRPGEIVLASSGGWMHFASAFFQSLSKQKFNIVLYKGGFPAMIDVIGGQAHATFAVSVPALPFLRSGQLKGLAVSTLKRTELLPDLPTLDEAGVNGYDAANWYAVAAPAGTPRAIVMKLHNEIARFFTSPEVLKKITAMGAVIDIKTPDEMRKIIPAEITKWTKVAIDADMPRAVK